MFFELSKKSNPLYTNTYKVGDYFLSTDDGWREINVGGKKAVVKGYCLEAPLEKAAFEIPQYRGLFCSIAETNQGVLVTHGIFRAFKLYDIGDGVTNFDDGEYIAANAFWRDNKTEFFDIVDPNLQTPKNVDEAILLIDGYIEENVKQFVSHNKGNILATITGGLDTTLVYSYLESLSVPHTPMIDKHFEFNRFLVDNHAKINKFAKWLYDINHYRTPAIVTSGELGDDMFFRYPWLMSGLDANKMYRYEEGDYRDLSYDEPLSLSDALYTMNQANGMFHVGNTMYFNPLQDMRIPYTLIKLDRDELISAVRKATFQKKLIVKRCPWLKDYLPDRKELNIFAERRKLLHRLLDLDNTKKLLDTIV